MRYSRLGFLGLPVAAAVLFTAGVLALQMLLPPDRSWIKAVLLSVIVIAALGLNLSSYRHADEVILARNKTAWFWASHAAIAIGMPVIIGVAWSLIPVPPSFPADPKAAFAVGFGFLIVLQCIAFALAQFIRNRR